MKPVVVIIMICFSLSLLPVAVTSPSAAAAGRSIMTLDVCKAAGSAIRCGSDLPSLCECPCGLAQAGLAGYCCVVRPGFYLSVADSPEGRPPQLS